MAVGGDLLGPAGVPVGKVAGVVLVVFAASECRRGTRPAPPAMLAWLATIVVCGISVHWSLDREASLRVFRHLSQEALVLAVLAITPRREQVVRALAVGVAVGAVGLAVGLFAALATENVQGGRLVVLAGDPNHLGRQVAFGLVLLLAMGRARVEAVSVLLALGVGLSGSRGAWLATGLTAVLLTVRPPTLATRRHVAVALVGLVTGAWLLTTTPGARSVLPSEDREALSSGRDAIWANTIDIIRDHPTRGVGIGAVPAVYDTYRDARMARGGLHSKPGRDPHSHYLQLLAETGPVGLLVFLFGIVAAFVAARRSGRREATAVLVLVAVGAATVGTVEQKTFWLALAWASLAASPPEEDVALRPGRAP